MRRRGRLRRMRYCLRRIGAVAATFNRADCFARIRKALILRALSRFSVSR